MSLENIIISGGGTGGHIYPALAIADEIKRRYPECTIRFVGAEGRMEMEKVPAAGYPIDGLWITGIERKLLSKKNLLFPFRLISSLRKSKKLIKKHKPQAAVGVGGFASGPLLHVASKRGIPTLIQEQNSYPGITNKILAKRVTRICTGFEKMETWFPPSKSIHTGNPLRGALTHSTPNQSEALQHFGLEPNTPTVFIMGGSLGALSLNDAVFNAMHQWTKEGIQVLWQTGKRFYEKNKALVEQEDIQGVKVLGFIDRMDLAYSSADIIVSRAGAMSIAELAIVSKPTIFVPSPHVAEDHQTHNARSLTDHQAALLITDKSVRTDLGSAVSELMSDEAKRKALSERMHTHAHPDAAKKVVDEIEKIVQGK